MHANTPTANIQTARHQEHDLSTPKFIAESAEQNGGALNRKQEVLLLDILFAELLLERPLKATDRAHYTKSAFKG